MNILRRASILVALATALFGTNFASASSPRDVTPEERALLSPWCNNTNGMPGYREMLAKYGDGWSHMHHYCYAELDAMRLNRQFGSKPRGYASVNRAIGNLDYVLQRTTPEFAFWKDAQILKIRLVDRYVDQEGAIKLATQLVEQLPELADGYTILAGLLLKADRRDEANRVLASGAEKAADKERFERQRSILPLR